MTGKLARELYLFGANTRSASKTGAKSMSAPLFFAESISAAAAAPNAFKQPITAHSAKTLDGLVVGNSTQRP
jgi:hypothetical protein